MKKYDVIINCYKEHKDAVVPDVAYEGTSAAFDITCVESITIEPGCSGVVENGLRLSIDQTEPYYMTINLRSSTGFKYDAVPHHGIVDGGYTGPFGVKIYNIGKDIIKINKGDKYAQVTVLKKPSYKINELNTQEFEDFKSNQVRGDKGFGSSGNSI